MSVNKLAPRPVNPNKSIKHAAAHRRGSVILNKFQSYPWRRGRDITKLRLHRLPDCESGCIMWSESLDKLKLIQQRSVTHS